MNIRALNERTCIGRSVASYVKLAEAETRHAMLYQAAKQQIYRFLSTQQRVKARMLAMSRHLSRAPTQWLGRAVGLQIAQTPGNSGTSRVSH